jgi:hypothetical protein
MRRSLWLVVFVCSSTVALTVLSGAVPVRAPDAPEARPALPPAPLPAALAAPPDDGLESLLCGPPFVPSAPFGATWGERGWSRPWLESETHHVVDDVLVDVRVEGAIRCEEPRDVRYTAHVKFRNEGRRSGWVLESVCGGQGGCGTPWAALELGDRRDRYATFAARHLSFAMVRVAPTASTTLVLPLVECSAPGPPLAARFRYDVSAYSDWRQWRDAYSGVVPGRGARLLIESFESKAFMLRCLEPRATRRR